MSRPLRFYRPGAPPWLVAYWCWSLRAVYYARGIPVSLIVDNDRAAMEIGGGRLRKLVRFGWCDGTEFTLAVMDLRDGLRRTHGLN